MFKFSHQNILCPAQSLQFINNVETVILQLINSIFYLLCCATCISLYNVSILIHDCNLIKSTSPSIFKYYHNNLPPNHLNKDVFL